MKKPNERMEEAKLSELMPGFDKEMEWNKLHAQLQGVPARKLPDWKIAAAIMLLVASGAVVALLNKDISNSSNNTATISDTPSNWAKGVLPAMPTPPSYATAGNKERDRIIVKIADATVKQPNTTDTARILQGIRRSGEFVCNSTPCPIEICITQTLRCKELAPSAVKSCSVLDPDQARQLRFNNPNTTTRNCNVSVSEISIERVATGEMIVLNDNSRPSTAQELFNCLTGNMECSMLAGIFKTDCNNHQRPDKLKIEKDAGSIILE